MIELGSVLKVHIKWPEEFIRLLTYIVSLSDTQFYLFILCLDRPFHLLKVGFK